MAIDREVFAVVCLIAVFALFCDVSLKYRASAQSPVCQNFATGCPESKSNQSQGLCLQQSGSPAPPLGVVTDTQNCARYVFCTGPGSGIAFKCPVGTVPGNICVPDPNANTTNQCDPPCTTVDGCLIGPAQGNDSTVCPPPVSGIPATVVSHPDYCGVFILCIAGHVAYEYKCPPGYRGLSGSIMELKCAPDPTCKAWNDSHPAPCTDVNTGCPLTPSWIDLPICQNFTSTMLGSFDFPNQCGRYMVCLTSLQGMVFECPYGYRTVALAFPRCIADQSCHYPTAPRTPLIFGAGRGTPSCLDHYNGCIVRPTYYVSCNNAKPGTVFIDNVRCGYWTECSGSGSNATVRVCPAGYRSNPVYGKDGICVNDSIGCPTPESSRMLTPSSGLHHTNACLNVAFGCMVPRSTNNSSHIWNECLNRPWTSVPEILNCRRYIICLPGSHGIEMECPNGYRATPNAIGDAQCSVDSSCS